MDNLSESSKKWLRNTTGLDTTTKPGSAVPLPVWTVSLLNLASSCLDGGVYFIHLVR